MRLRTIEHVLEILHGSEDVGDRLRSERILAQHLAHQKRLSKASATQ